MNNLELHQGVTKQCRPPVFCRHNRPPLFSQTNYTDKSSCHSFVLIYCDNGKSPWSGLLLHLVYRESEDGNDSGSEDVANVSYKPDTRLWVRWVWRDHKGHEEVMIQRYRRQRSISKRLAAISARTFGAPMKNSNQFQRDFPIDWFTGLRAAKGFASNEIGIRNQLRMQLFDPVSWLLLSSERFLRRKLVRKSLTTGLYASLNMTKRSRRNLSLVIVPQRACLRCVGFFLWYRSKARQICKMLPAAKGSKLPYWKVVVHVGEHVDEHDYRWLRESTCDDHVVKRVWVELISGGPWLATRLM